jgi:hypothetical protein
MQEKKNKRLLISLVLLLAITAFLFWFTNRDNTIHVDKEIFKVEELASVDKVVLESSQGKTELSYNGSKWKVNNEYPADRNMINALFITLQKAEPKRTIANTAKDSMTQVLEKNGVLISLFVQNQLIKSFYAGGNISKTQSYFKDPQQPEAYVMTIPGYRVYVSGILELDENGFRDKFVFAGFNWQNFKSLEAKFPGHDADNFMIARNKDLNFGVEGLPEVDTAKVNTFLDKISLLTVSRYTDLKLLRDSVPSSKPVMEITVKDIGDRTYTFEVLGMTSKGEISGIIMGKQGAFFNPAQINPILKPKLFFKKR